jgi:ubiquinone/menaquinone biosynthesis C-methylase UbiE
VSNVVAPLTWKSIQGAVTPTRTVRWVGSGVQRSYDLVAERYAAAVDDELAHRPLERALLAALPELAELGNHPGAVADLGAGPGHVARHLRAIGLSTVALDVAPAMATLALRRQRVPAAVGSLTALPLASSSLAGAVVLYAWIHLTDDEMSMAAAELRRVLRPGGVAIVSFHVGDEVVHLDEWHGHNVDLDFRFLQPTSVTALLEGAGMSVVATLERTATPDIEVPTRRCYLVARRRG